MEENQGFVILETRYGNLKLPLNLVKSKEEAQRRLRKALPHLPVDVRSKIGWLYKAITENWERLNEIPDYQRTIIETDKYIKDFNRDKREIIEQRQTPEHITAAQKFFDLKDKILKKTF
jgi:hypothetical protein